MSRYSDDGLVLSLVRQAGRVLDDLGLPPVFGPDELHTAVERHRGRPIRIRSYPMPAEGPHGLWLVGRSTDYIYVDRAAPPLRRRQILGHEYGHVVFDDPGAVLPGLEPQIAGARTLHAQTLRGCTRTGYAELIEQRCEWFGTVVLQRLRD